MKILKAILIILTVTTVIELGYYVYITTYENKSSSNKQISTQASSQPSITTDDLQKQQTHFEPLIPDSTIKYLQELPKTFEDNQKIYLVWETKGIIKNIGFDNDRNYLYFILVDEDGNTIQDYSIVEAQLQNIIFTKIVKDQEIPISYKNLKNDDVIINYSQMNLTTKEITQDKITVENNDY